MFNVVPHHETSGTALEDVLQYRSMCLFVYNILPSALLHLYKIIIIIKYRAGHQASSIPQFNALQ